MPNINDDVNSKKSECTRINRQIADLRAEMNSANAKIERLKNARAVIERERYNFQQTAKNTVCCIEDDYTWQGNTDRTFLDTGHELIDQNTSYSKYQIGRIITEINLQIDFLSSQIGRILNSINEFSNRVQRLTSEIDDLLN